MIHFHPLDINYLGVFVGAFTSFIVGFLWFGPFFGSAWIRNSGLTKRDFQKRPERSMNRLMGYNFLVEIVRSIIIAAIMNFMNPVDLSEVFTLIVLLWLGYVVTTGLNGILWEGEKIPFYIINIGHRLVSALAIAVLYHMILKLNDVDQIDVSTQATEAIIVGSGLHTSE